jgi:hypothetical protein
MADPWTSVWEEAEATAPPGVVMYATLELQHPAFLQGGVEVPIRCVTGVADDMNFGIEVGAVFNGGQTVTFKAIPFFAERPEFAEGKVPECQVTVDNVGRDLFPYIEAAVQVKADLAALYREYRSDDLTEPCYGPVRFVMRKVQIKGTSVIGTARLQDLANRKFPYKVYAVNEFPGLVSAA